MASQADIVALAKAAKKAGNIAHAMLLLAVGGKMSK
jgi:hypothetical protein